MKKFNANGNKKSLAFYGWIFHVLLFVENTVGTPEVFSQCISPLGMKFQGIFSPSTILWSIFLVGRRSHRICGTGVLLLYLLTYFCSKIGDGGYPRSFGCFLNEKCSYVEFSKKYLLFETQRHTLFASRPVYRIPSPSFSFFGYSNFLHNPSRHSSF